MELSENDRARFVKRCSKGAISVPIMLMILRKRARARESERVIDNR